MFLPSSYLQRMFDNFDWFSIYIIATVLMEFSVINFLQVLLLSLFPFSFSSSFPFSRVYFLFFVSAFFPYFVFDI